ncbi:MAG: hypothetical protein JXB88_11680 [Spirochaetales bacterium]|nr:hypothetical protein [Spirochaetales bacterium]
MYRTQGIAVHGLYAYAVNATDDVLVVLDISNPGAK